MAKSLFKNLILEFAENSGLLNMLQLAGPQHGQRVYVLAYHRVAELMSNPWLSPELISATPQQFDEQMKFIAERYRPISIHELFRAVHGQGILPKDAVLVTVDDGYRDFQDAVFPICARYGIQPLLFLPTAFVGAGHFWWDKVHQIIYLSGQSAIDTPVGEFPISTESDKHKTYEQLTYLLKRIPFEKVMSWLDHTYPTLVKLTEQHHHDTLTWDELRQLIDAGVAVAGHTHTHPILTQVSLEEARREVSLSQERIRQELGSELPVFAFPDGKLHAFSPVLCEMLYSEGFEMLFLLVGGRAMIQAGHKKIILPRLSVWQSQTLPQFHLRLTPTWAFYESARSGIRKIFLGSEL